MKNVRDAGFSRKRGGNAGSGPPLPDPLILHPRIACDRRRISGRGLHSYTIPIEKQVKSIDVDKGGRKKPLASKS